MDPIKGSEDSMDIEAPWKVSDDGQSAAETLGMKQLAGTGETEHPISQHQATHDDQTAAGSSSQKRGGETPLLDKEDQKRRKQIADKKCRAKKKAEVEKTKVDLLNTMKKVEDLEIENKSLNEKIKSTEQQLKNAAAHIGKLTFLIERLNETDNSKQQDYVRKLEKELQGLKIKYRKFQCKNASLKAEQQQFEDFCTNELNQIQELPMEQEQLGPEENGQLGFVGDGRPTTTTGEMQEFKSMLMAIMQQNEQISQRIDDLKTSTSMAIEQISQRISALETRNPHSQA